jgi:hypothetical protein
MTKMLAFGCKGLAAFVRCVLFIAFAGTATHADAQYCLTGGFESRWIDCSNTEGCSTQAEQKWCGSTLQVSTNKCSCVFYIIPCCGANIDTRQPDPCGWECVGAGCEPAKGDLRIASTEVPQPSRRGRGTGLPNWLAAAPTEQQP